MIALSRTESAFLELLQAGIWDKQPNLDTIEKRFDRYLNTCADLVKLYTENNIKTMVLKGIGLAYQYPVPQHRECGDIDIWLFGDYNRGNEVVLKQGIEIDHDDGKHNMFYFKGIPIENHRAFLNEHAFKRDVKLESALNEIILKDECVELPLSQNISILIPPPTFNAIFLARHMTSHFFEGIPIRQLFPFRRYLLWTLRKLR